MRVFPQFLLFLVIASAGVAVALLVVTGRGYTYGHGVGAMQQIRTVASTAGGLALLALGAAAILHSLAQSFPKKYFQILWWRDAAWIACLIAALGVIYAEIASVVLYGGI